MTFKYLGLWYGGPICPLALGCEPTRIKNAADFADFSPSPIQVLWSGGLSHRMTRWWVWLFGEAAEEAKEWPWPRRALGAIQPLSLCSYDSVQWLSSPSQLPHWLRVGNSSFFTGLL